MSAIVQKFPIHQLVDMYLLYRISNSISLFGYYRLPVTLDGIVMLAQNFKNFHAIFYPAVNIIDSCCERKEILVFEQRSYCSNLPVSFFASSDSSVVFPCVTNHIRGRKVTHHKREVPCFYS